MANEETLPTDEEIAAAQTEANHIDNRLTALEAENARLSAQLIAAESDRDANMEAAVAAARQVEALRSELAKALETAASEKARADKGKALLEQTADVLPAPLIAVYTERLRAKQAEAQAAAEAAAAELAALGH